MSAEEADLELEEGWVAAELAEEFNDLVLRWVAVTGRTARTPPEIRERLRHMSDRFRGAQAIALRREPVPSAYRVFFRQVGLDPDAQRIPVEEAAVERLVRGEFASQDLVEDALLIALMETGVPIWALDADTLDGPLGLRLAVADEDVGRGGSATPARAGSIVVADAAGPVATLFATVARDHAVLKRTRRIALFAVGVPGVPSIFLEESFWAALGVLETGP